MLSNRCRISSLEAQQTLSDTTGYIPQQHSAISKLEKQSQIIASFLYGAELLRLSLFAAYARDSNQYKQTFITELRSFRDHLEEERRRAKSMKELRGCAERLFLFPTALGVSF